MHCGLDGFMLFKQVGNLVKHGAWKTKFLRLQWDSGSMFWGHPETMRLRYSERESPVICASFFNKSYSMSESFNVTNFFV